MGRRKSRRGKGSRAGQAQGAESGPATPSLTPPDSEAGEFEDEKDCDYASDRDEGGSVEQGKELLESRQISEVGDGQQQLEAGLAAPAASPPPSSPSGVPISEAVERRQSQEEAATHVEFPAVSPSPASAAVSDDAMQAGKKSLNPKQEASPLEQGGAGPSSQLESGLQEDSMSAAMPEQKASGEVGVLPDQSLPDTGASMARSPNLVSEGSLVRVSSAAIASDTDFIVLAAEVERLEGALAESQRSLEGAEARLVDAQNACAEVPNLRQKLTSLEAEIQDRDMQLKQAHQERGQLLEEISGLKERVVEVRVQTRKEVQKAETEAVRSRVERAERALEHERKEKNQIKKQLAEAMGASEAGTAALGELSALKEQLRDTQTELDAAQEGLAAETALVGRLKDQLTVLLASGDVKLKEHAEMWEELKQLRETVEVTKSEKATCEQELEASRLAIKATEIKVSTTESLCMDLQSKCQSLGETLGKMMDENAELAEILNRKAEEKKSTAQVFGPHNRDGAIEENEGEGAVTREGGNGEQEGAEGVTPSRSMGESELQLLVLAEEVGRLERELQDERTKLSALAEAAAVDDAELGTLRAKVQELQELQKQKEEPNSPVREKDIHEEDDRQHAALLALHREVANLKAELTEARSQLRRAGVAPDSGKVSLSPAPSSDRIFDPSEATVTSAAETSEEAGRTSEIDHHSENADTVVAGAALGANHIAPEQPSGSRPPPRRPKDIETRQGSRGGLWGFISGAP